MDQTPPSSSPDLGDDFKIASICDAGPNVKGAAVKGKYNSYEKAKVAVAPGKCSNEPDAILFHAGDTIGPQTFWFYGSMDSEFYNSNTEYNYNCGQWRPGDRGFLGFKIIIDCNAYFGWADVTWNTDSCFDGPNFTLHSYAINTEPNESIAAGEKKTKQKHLHVGKPTCTPTPSTTPPPSGAGSAIGLLIAGAAGIASLKQRRQ